MEEKKEKVKKPKCKKCNDLGWYFVNEWIGTLQGRKNCNCKQIKQK